MTPGILQVYNSKTDEKTSTQQHLYLQDNCEVFRMQSAMSEEMHT